MAVTATFDTLAYAKKLKSAGFTEEQAEIQAEALSEIIEERQSTKQDLRELEMRLKHDLTLRLGGYVGCWHCYYCYPGKTTVAQ